MANTKQRTYVQKRDQQRQRRPGPESARPRQSRVQSARRRQGRPNNTVLVGGILVVVILVIGIFIVVSNIQSAAQKANQDQALKALMSPDSAIFSKVGSGSAQNKMHAASSQILKGNAGKPVIFYVGGEYCPYCAAQRWALISALSRFGKFSNLEGVNSGEGNVPTFTFHGSSYTSQYIELQAVEISNNQAPPNTQPLDKLTTEQQSIFDQYDKQPYTPTQGGIPFLSIANQLVSGEPYYSPDVLVGHSYQEIADQLKDPNSDITKGIIGSSNYITAAICSVTANVPTDVCTSAPIPTLRGSLPNAAFVPQDRLALVTDTTADVLPLQGSVRRGKNEL